MIKPGSRSAAMVNWTDLLPTLVDAAGGTPPQQIDGRSFLPVLRGETQEHRDRIFTTHSGDGRWNIYPIRAVRSGDWKYICNLHAEFAFTTHIDLPGNLGQRGYFASWEAKAMKDLEAAAIVQRYARTRRSPAGLQRTTVAEQSGQLWSSGAVRQPAGSQAGRDEEG
jgi:arylsulfatase A-like enzyme